jgi:dienelactone hydrolase
MTKPIDTTAIRTQGLVGALCAPVHTPSPGVLLLGGSEGGLHEDDAAWLAGRGYAVLALGYFGMAGVPGHLVDIPLEYFGTALRFLAGHDRVRGDRPAVLGGSFGGQAALLTGAMFPEVRAVVSVAGSGVITQGIDGDVSDGDFEHIMCTEVAPWTWRGERLPFIANPMTPALRGQVAAGEPVAMRMAFEEGMRDTGRVAAATIPVEHIQGAVLLISAGEDRSWPCEALSEIAMRRLTHHPHEHRHVVCPTAGHGICLPPYRGAADTVVPGPGVLLDLGGTPQDTSAARRLAWAEVLAFLAAHLRN